MKALKGLLIYIGIVIGGLAGLALILFCAMYFFPSFRIAGLGVIHKTETIEEDVITLSNYSGYNDIAVSVKSGNVGINVYPTDKTDIVYDAKLKVFGLSTEIVEYTVLKQVDVKDNVLNIYLTITEPSGWLSVSESCINIGVPSTTSIGININTEKGDISIGSDDLLINLDDIVVNTGTGDFEIVNVGTGETEKSLTVNSLNLTTEKGEFDFSSIDNLTVNSKVKLKAEDSEFKFKNLYASLDVIGTNVRIIADTISCGASGLSCVTESGKIKVKNLTTSSGAENTFISDNFSYDITELKGKTAIVTTSGNINIGTSNDYLYIENEHGNVYVKNAKSTIIATTYMGNITIENYYATGNFTSDKGDITVNNHSEYNSGFYTEIKNVDGKVVVYNKVNRLLLTTTGRSNVEVTFGEIKEGEIFQHKINTSTQGSCVVYMPTVNVPPYKFVAKGIISGEIGVSISASENDQFYPSLTYKNQAVLNASFEFIGRITFKSYSNISN